MSVDDVGERDPPAVLALRDDLAALGREPVVVPPDLARTVVRRVRALRAPRGTLALADVERGATLVAERAVGRVAAAAARGVPGVVYASVRVEEEGSATVRLVAELGPRLDGVAAAVRAAVLADVERWCGIELSAVDVRVDDVTD